MLYPITFFADVQLADCFSIVPRGTMRRAHSRSRLHPGAAYTGGSPDTPTKRGSDQGLSWFLRSRSKSVREPVVITPAVRVFGKLFDILPCPDAGGIALWFFLAKERTKALWFFPA